VRGKTPNTLEYLKINDSVNFKAKEKFIEQHFQLNGNFGANYVRIMHANFQASSFTGVGGE